MTSYRLPEFTGILAAGFSIYPPCEFLTERVTIVNMFSRRGEQIFAIDYRLREVILETGEIVDCNYCDHLNGATHVTPNCAEWLRTHGEELVEEMTETGDVTNETVREIFPRVTFRDVADAEMVAETLIHSLKGFSVKAANAVKVFNMKNMVGSIGNHLPFSIEVEALVMDGNGDTVDPAAIVKEITSAMEQMNGFLESVIAQIAQLYVAPDAENAKYISRLLDFVNEVREYIDAAELVVTKMQKTGEQ